MHRLVTMTVGVYQPFRYVQDMACPPCPRHGRKDMVEAVICPAPGLQLPVYVCSQCHAQAKPGEGVYTYQPQSTFDAMKTLMEKKWIDGESISKYVN